MSTFHQRYLIGREALLLMGCPLHRLNISRNSETESLMQSIFEFPWFVFVPTDFGLDSIHLRHPKEMHDLAGNSMAVRAIMAIVCSALSLTSAPKMAPR